ncbi:SDR family NAD(P)-dependent oxidoreductase [Nostocoides sp. HKS02]|uniref:SDR family NAD(P)-dependent oxidoreductase n=1 Tax=Nostocoides sp. HKS02 TaxID=1813880 RepID=UPI0018A80D80|nr:SDR family oxidoreductase [Tetrasphaera sp. HKS02]
MTGAATGLGLGIAERFVADGCVEVHGLDITPTPDRVVPGLQHRTVDVGDAQEVDDCVEAILTAAGRIDILVCNAAIMQDRHEVLQTPDELVERVLRVNFGGVFNLCRAVGRAMKDAGSGRVVTVSSQVAETPWPGMAVYAASKAAVTTFTRAFALEMAPYGVYVNTILPGTMDTNQMRDSFAGLGRMTGADPESLIAAKRTSMPLGRMGTPQDAANLASWLASDQASFSIGGVFDLTGGELWSRS